MDRAPRSGLGKPTLGITEGVIIAVTVLLSMVAIVAEQAVSASCALCAPKEWSAVLDVVIGIAFVAAGLLIRTYKPRNLIWGLLVAAGLGRLLEETFSSFGDTLFAPWYITRLFLLVAVLWVAAMYYPHGRTTTVGRVIAVNWLIWALVASVYRLLNASPASLLPGERVTALPDSPEGTAVVLSAILIWSNVAQAAGVAFLLRRWWTGGPVMRRAFAPLFFILPFIVGSIFDEFLVDTLGVPETFRQFSVWGDYIIAVGLPLIFLFVILGAPPWRRTEFDIGTAGEVLPDAELATVMFVDIVDSTRHAARLGDRRWAALLSEFRELIRVSFARHGGHEENLSGDGFLATFRTPAGAIECSLEVAATTGELGLEVRAGVHIGEVARLDDELSGVAVHVGQRVMAEAGPSSVLVTQIVKDLVERDGYVFEDAGLHELKGVDGAWQLWSAGRESVVEAVSVDYPR